MFTKVVYTKLQKWNQPWKRKVDACAVDDIDFVKHEYGREESTAIFGFSVLLSILKACRPYKPSAQSFFYVGKEEDQML